VLQTTYYAEGYIESLQYSALSYSPASHFQSPTMFPSQMGEILRFTTFWNKRHFTRLSHVQVIFSAPSLHITLTYVLVEM